MNLPHSLAHHLHLIGTLDVQPFRLLCSSCIRMTHTFLNVACESFFRKLRQSGSLANTITESGEPFNPCRTLMRIHERILETLRALKP